MDVKEYRGWLIVGSLALMLLAATPTLALYLKIPSGSERFSELWLLGSGHKAEDYPSNVKVNETYSVFVGVVNHLGYSAYYNVSVKFRNQTQQLPVASNATHSALPTLYEFNFFVGNDEAWEALLNFKILNVERSNDYMIVNSLSINNVLFQVDTISKRDETRNGFYYQLFFELWLYNITSQSFQYNNHVGLWLNVTDFI